MADPVSKKLSYETARREVNMLSPEIAHLIRTVPECKEAAAFKNICGSLDDEIEYGWAADYAKERYDQFLEAHEKLDDKASTVASYLGSGIGAFSLAAIAAVSTNNIDPIVVLFALIPILLAATSLVLATLARRPSIVYSPPIPKVAKEYADYFRTDNKARCAFIGQWNLSVELLRDAVAKKQLLVNASAWFFVSAIATVLIPVVVAAILKL